MLSIKQGFYAMYYLFDYIWVSVKNSKFNVEKSEFEDFTDLISDINPFLFASSLSSDPATWEDWKKCVQIVKGQVSDSPLLSPHEVLECIYTLIKFYEKKFNFKIDFIKYEVEMLKQNQDSNIATLTQWKNSIEKSMID